MSEDKKVLTVAELIELLQKCPQHLSVMHEGCDCYGDANGVEVHDNIASDAYVLITRSN